METKKYLRKRQMNQPIDSLVDKGYVNPCPTCGGTDLIEKPEGVACSNCRRFVANASEELFGNSAERRLSALKRWNNSANAKIIKQKDESVRRDANAVDWKLMASISAKAVVQLQRIADSLHEIEESLSKKKQKKIPLLEKRRLSVRHNEENELYNDERSVRWRFHR